MLRMLYRLLLVPAYPLARLRLAWRARRDRAYGERVSERFGHVAEELPRGAVWFHTVSAGETISAVPLIRRLTEEFPELPFLVTTMTPTGSAQVRQRLGDGVAHCYAPYDFPRAVERFFERMQPRDERLRHAALRQLRQERLARPAPARARPHIEVFQIDAVAAGEGGEVVEPQGHAHRRAVHAIAGPRRSRRP